MTTPEIYIGETLFDLQEMKSDKVTRTHRYRLHDDASWNLTSTVDFTRWLKSPGGLTAIENAMIKRGYNFTICHANGFQWAAKFNKSGWPEIFVGDRCADNKASAMIGAVCKTLLGEVQ